MTPSDPNRPTDKPVAGQIQPASSLVMHWNARGCPPKARRLLGIHALRLSLVVIYIWFGALKLVDLSPACALVAATAKWAPIFDAPTWVCIMGWGEIGIGLMFILPKTVRLGVVLLAFHIVGTALPLFLLPELSFQSEHGLYAPTMTGQYIIKNLLLIATGLVIGGAVCGKSKSV